MDNSLYHLVSNVMFNAAWGNYYYKAFSGYSNDQVDTLISSLTETDLFQSMYPQDSDAEFADAFIANVTHNVVDAQSIAWAQDQAHTLLASGATRPDIVSWVVNALNTLTDTHSSWGSLKAFYNNREQVSEFFSLEAELPAQTLSELQAVVENVTEDPVTVLEKTHALRLEYGLDMPDMPLEAEILLSELAPGQKGYEEFATTFDPNDPAIGEGYGFHIPDTVKDSVIIADRDSGYTYAAGSYVSTQISVDTADDAKVKLVIPTDNKIFSETPEMAWLPDNYVIWIDGEHLGSRDVSPSEIGIYYAEEAFIDASTSQRTPIDYNPEYPDIPVFSTRYFGHYANKLFIDTGDANSIIQTPSLSVYAMGQPLGGERLSELPVIDDYLNYELIANIGDGIYAIEFYPTSYEVDIHEQMYTHGSTKIYGFDENDVLLNGASYTSWEDFETLLANTTIEDGNTIITLPDFGATITLVGYDNLQPEQFAWFGSFYEVLSNKYIDSL